MLSWLITVLFLFIAQDVPEDWEGMEEVEHTSAFMQFMSSNDLILIVLAASLLIWFTLLFFLIRVDRKVTQLEQQNHDQDLQ